MMTIISEVVIDSWVLGVILDSGGPTERGSHTNYPGRRRERL